MNTNLRKKKRNDVVNKVAEIWNDRLSRLIKEHFGSQKAFALEYKVKNGTGNQADVSRWVNVGGVASKGEVIGFPEYDTMRRIADFFGVTVGYLTGETDYESFELERTCDYLGIDEATAKAIERITKMKGATRFEKYEKINYGKALCVLLTTEHFEDFLGGICQYAEAKYRQAHPIDYMNSPQIASIRPEILDFALKYRDVGFEEEIDEPLEISDEVLEAMDILAEAESKDYNQQFVLERDIKIAKCDLQERYFQLVTELFSSHNWTQIQSHYYETYTSVTELKKRIDNALPSD